MKKIIIIFALVLSGLTASAQEFEMFTGVSVYNAQTSNVGWNFGMIYSKFYVDFSFNGQSGEGEHLDFMSSQTVKTSKKNRSMINVGYVIEIRDWISLIPVVGIAQTATIYEDPIGWATYFMADPEYKGNIGINARLKLSDHIGILVGTGTEEIFKASISYRF